MPLLQAHRGVASDYPENTFAAFYGAAEQGYKIIELDPWVTADGKIVILHDRKINRTARNFDGSPIENETQISDITYEQACKYEYGSWFSKKFAGEKLPLLEDVLTFARQNGLHIKLDNRIQGFEEKALAALFETVNKSGADVGFTTTEIGFAKTVLKHVKNAKIHYDGEVTNAAIAKLSALLPKEKLVIWLRYSAELDADICTRVKDIACLGLWILTEKSQYEHAAALGADIVETTGTLKPVMRQGVVVDTHVHSECSHDSQCPVSEMRAAAEKCGLYAICITDHCDVGIWDTTDIHGIIRRSVEGSRAENAKKGAVKVLSGVEMGESMWHIGHAKQILSENIYDEVIGSVHAVQYEGYTDAYSQIKFSEMSREQVQSYLKQYFADMVRMINETEFDILAHITCPLRYINGKYGSGIDAKLYATEVREILQMIIARGIALEVNTSCRGSNYDEYMPEKWIVQLYRELGGHLITVGSDAHVSQNSAKDFENLLQMLKETGFDYICYFENRRILQCTL